MNRLGRLRLRRWLPKFQYSIGNLFTLVSLAAVTLAIGRFNADAGVLAGVLLFGGWLCAALAGVQWFRGAYFAAAFTAGVLWYLAASLPVTLVSGLFAAQFPNWKLLAGCCLASLASSGCARILGLHESNDSPLISGAILTLIMAVWLAALGALAEQAGLEEFRHFSTLFEVWYLAIVALIFSGFLLVPCGVLVLIFLREAERMALDAAREERAVYDAVDELERRGDLLILAADVARQAKLEQARTDQCLIVLRQKEFLEFNPEEGYRCKRVVAEKENRE